MTLGDPRTDLDLTRFTDIAFTVVQFREGYTLNEVDAFIGRAVRSLGSPAPTLTAQDVRDVRFTPVRLRQGYEMAEVDAYLDDLEHHLEARQRTRPPAPEADSAVEPSAGSGPGRLTARVRGAWTGSSRTGRVAAVAVPVGALVGLLVGLWPGAPGTVAGLLYGIVFGAALAGLLVTLKELVSVAAAVVEGVVFVVRRTVRAARGQEPVRRTPHQLP